MSRLFLMVWGKLDKQPIVHKNLIRERIVNGDIRSTVWWLAWPSALTMLLQTANGLIDIAFVGRIGAPALTGVGLASQAMLILMSIAAAIGVATTALVSRFIGANEEGDAKEAVKQSILLGIIVSGLMGILMFAIGPILIATMGGEAEGLQLGVIYLNITLIGIIPFYLMFVLTGIYRGMGDVRSPLIIMSAVTAVNVIGLYLLVFGPGPFPALGVAGAAIATMISRVVAVVLFVYYLRNSIMKISLREEWRPSWNWFRRILNIGTPVGVQGLLRTLASMTYYGILGLTPEATASIAALTIGLRTEALAFMPGFAFSVAVTSIVGQNLGARKPERAEYGAWIATKQGVMVMGGIGVIFIIFATPIASLFTNDPEVLPLAASFLRINGLVEPFLALGMVLTGALQGAGETRLPTLVTIVTMWFGRLPLTYYLAITLGMGAIGAWVAMAVTTVLGGILMLAIFKWSNWKHKVI